MGLGRLGLPIYVLSGDCQVGHSHSVKKGEEWQVSRELLSQGAAGPESVCQCLLRSAAAFRHPHATTIRIGYSGFAA